MSASQNKSKAINNIDTLQQINGTQKSNTSISIDMSTVGRQVNQSQVSQSTKLLQISAKQLPNRQHTNMNTFLPKGQTTQISGNNRPGINQKEAESQKITIDLNQHSKIPSYPKSGQDTRVVLGNDGRSTGDTSNNGQTLGNSSSGVLPTNSQEYVNGKSSRGEANLQKDTISKLNINQSRQIHPDNSNIGQIKRKDNNQGNNNLIQPHSSSNLIQIENINQTAVQIQSNHDVGQLTKHHLSSDQSICNGKSASKFSISIPVTDTQKVAQCSVENAIKSNGQIIIPPNDQTSVLKNLNHDLNMEAEKNGNFIQIPMTFGNEQASAQQSSSTSSTLLKKRGFSETNMQEESEAKPRKISIICIDQTQVQNAESQPSSDIDDLDDLDESNEIEEEANPDTKIVFDFFGGDAVVESKSPDSHESSDLQNIHDKKESDEIPNHNGIISIENLPSQTYVESKTNKTSIIVQKAKLSSGVSSQKIDSSKFVAPNPITKQVTNTIIPKKINTQVAPIPVYSHKAKQIVQQTQQSTYQKLLGQISKDCNQFNKTLSIRRDQNREYFQNLAVHVARNERQPLNNHNNSSFLYNGYSNPGYTFFNHMNHVSSLLIPPQQEQIKKQRNERKERQDQYMRHRQELQDSQNHIMYEHLNHIQTKINEKESYQSCYQTQRIQLRKNKDQIDEQLEIKNEEVEKEHSRLQQEIQAIEDKMNEINDQHQLQIDSLTKADVMGQQSLFKQNPEMPHMKNPINEQTEFI